MPRFDPQITTLPVDTQIGGDAAQPGTANSVTADDITAIYSDNRLSVLERQESLQKLRQEMVARSSADEMNDSAALVKKIDEGLAYLSQDSEGFASPDALDHSDTAVNPSNL